MADQIEETNEVRTTNAQVGDESVQRQTVSRTTSVSGAVVAQRVVWYITGFIVAILAIRLLLLLLGANQGNGFVDFIYSLTNVFALPFYGIFSYEPAYGKSVFEISTVVAMAVYALAGWGIAKLFTLGSNARV